MDADEREICIYLKSMSGQFISGKEIARRAAGKRRFRQEPDWAAPILARLVERGILEGDAAGHYRLIPREQRIRSKRWASPQIKKILEQSGKDFEIAGYEEEEDWENL